MAFDSGEKKKDKNHSLYLKGYEDLEVSTQVLIREALKNNIKVDVLDRNDNIIRLSYNEHIEYIKQASETSKDNLISYFLMLNKEVSKILLHEKGIRVPKGSAYGTYKDAIADYDRYKNEKVVVKPKSTNYGIGIGFVEPGEKDIFVEAVHFSFQYDKEILVEEFLEGKEYRFLVFGDEVVAIVHRIAANVVGDGKSTIRELASLKNHDPKYNKLPEYYISFTEKELEHLSRQNLEPESVLEEGRQVFLRTNSNVSTGGDAIDYTDKIPENYKKLAVQAAMAADANICGVDMIIKDYDTPPTDDNYGIIEINFNPTLFMHQHPTFGSGQNVGQALLDYLGF
jgi:glutamate--cysteine ligase